MKISRNFLHMKGVPDNFREKKGDPKLYFLTVCLVEEGMEAFEPKIWYEPMHVTKSAYSHS